ncbi:MAG: hypothetical protein AB7O24_08925 [Kofleriaceae bacterium]
MYRDDREALQYKAEAAEREAERLRRENDEMRLVVTKANAGLVPSTFAFPAHVAYSVLDVRALSVEDRARLAAHGVTRFPVWATGLLNFFTLGLFSLIHFGLVHDKLPRATHNDPSAAKSIGFSFIPYFNLYWVFFNSLRLADRLDLQLRLRGLPRHAPKGLLIASSVLSVIPYVNIFIGLPIMWTITACCLQSTVNKVAALSPTDWDGATNALPSASVAPQDASLTPSSMSLGYPNVPMSPELIAREQKARKLVNWSHVLGWGGLGALVVGAPVAGAIAGAVGGAIVAGGAVVSAITGAVVGQVGRGMQGRVI